MGVVTVGVTLRTAAVLTTIGATTAVLTAMAASEDGLMVHSEQAMAALVQETTAMNSIPTIVDSMAILAIAAMEVLKVVRAVRVQQQPIPALSNEVLLTATALIATETIPLLILHSRHALRATAEVSQTAEGALKETESLATVHAAEAHLAEVRLARLAAEAALDQEDNNRQTR